MKELLVGVPEAARILGVGRTKLNAMVRSGSVASVTLGRRRLFRVADLEAFVDGLPTTDSRGCAQHAKVT